MAASRPGSPGYMFDNTSPHRGIGAAIFRNALERGREPAESFPTRPLRGTIVTGSTHPFQMFRRPVTRVNDPEEINTTGPVSVKLGDRSPTKIGRATVSPVKGK
jgi:hypothetical protein